MGFPTNLFLPGYATALDRSGARSPILFDAVQPELNQVVRFESSAGPSISLLEFDSEQVINFVESAVYDSGLAPVGSELERDVCVGLDGCLHFEACARRRYIIQYGPFATQASRFGLPLNVDKISAKIPVFFSSLLHKCMYRQIKWMVYSYPSSRSQEPGARSRIPSVRFQFACLCTTYSGFLLLASAIQKP